MSNYEMTDALCAVYDRWQETQNLKLGSADEHLFDETLNDNQRRWLNSFCQLWNITQQIEDDKIKNDKYIAEMLEKAVQSYFKAQTVLERDAAYEHVIEWYALDPDLPDDADIVSGVETMLRDRGCTYS